MTKVLMPAVEYTRALALLRKHGYGRAANTLEHAPYTQTLLNPAPVKPSKPRKVQGRLVSASGRTFRQTRGALTVQASQIVEKTQ
jgi:hypothetical protein